jgi:MFS superfamily sulfate permease-like transporter
VFLAGLMQMGLGVLRAGVIGYYFPNSVIRGMLAGIGVIIILKQLPYVFGADSGTAAAGVVAAFNNLHMGTVIISAVSLGILLLWEQSFMKPFAIVPGALVAVVVCAGLNLAFGPEMAVQGAQLVQLPIIGSVSELDAALESPLWSAITNGAVWITAATIAVVASMETLLSLEATDRMDPLKRESPANRELIAQGLGNTICGLVGGLPMTGVIVRSSANVYAGAKRAYRQSCTARCCLSRYLPFRHC